MKITKRRQVEQQVEAMRTERLSFYNHWKEIADTILPTRPRFLVDDTQRGKKKYNKILDLTGALAARTLSAGMMAGLTSPARPWKRLSSHDAELAEQGDAKNWFHHVDSRMSGVFARSNLYRSLSQLYGDNGTFGTAAMLVEEDFNKTISTFTYPVGSFMIALDDKLKARVFAREFQLSVRQLVRRFGGTTGTPDWTKFSSRVKGLYENGQYETLIPVTYLCQPNESYNPAYLTSKKFESLYWETGFPDASSDKGKYLREAGYDYFPVLVARWDAAGEDVYGTSCPGMMALGNINQLQYGEKKILQAHEKGIDPPMLYPLSLQNKNITGLPGEKIYIDEREGMKGARSLYDSKFSSEPIELKQQQLRRVVDECYYKNLFLMFTGLDRKQITAAEIYARQEEKLLLGEVLEGLNNDVFDPLIDIVFDIMLKQGQIPPPPEELQGQDLKVEYVSIMHQSMKIAGLSSIDRLAQYVTGMAAANPAILDKYDFDQSVDEYAEVLGTPPRLVRPDEDVEEMRMAKAKLQAMQMQADAMEQGARTVKDLSGAKMGGDSALDAMVQASQAGTLVPQR